MIQFQLSVMDLDLVLVMDENPRSLKRPIHMLTSFFEDWKRTSKLLLNLMRLTVATNVKPCMPKRGNVLKFIKLARDYSHSNITDKALWDTYQVS